MKTLLLFSVRLIDITDLRIRWLRSVAEQITREQIILHYRQKLIAALEGRCKMVEVCGLGIETLLASIICERDNLLAHHGYGPGEQEGRLMPNDLERRSDQ